MKLLFFRFMIIFLSLGPMGAKAQNRTFDDVIRQLDTEAQAIVIEELAEADQLHLLDLPAEVSTLRDDRLYPVTKAELLLRLTTGLVHSLGFEAVYLRRTERGNLGFFIEGDWENVVDFSNDVYNKWAVNLGHGIGKHFTVGAKVQATRGYSLPLMGIEVGLNFNLLKKRDLGLNFKGTLVRPLQGEDLAWIGFPELQAGISYKIFKGNR